MKTAFDKVKRFGGIGLEIALVVFLLAMLLNAWKTPESQASSAESSSKMKVKPATAGQDPLLPQGGTPICNNPDTTPPSITCPANVTAVTAQTCPLSSSVVVNFPPPTASDNCPGVTTSCMPSSGSTFPIGTTVVTCTATDASGNTATCSFTVTVFNGCLQDEANPGNLVLFNTFGAYRFCCDGTIFTGTGTVTSQGCNFTIVQNRQDRRVMIKVSFTNKNGSASLQFPPGNVICTITDKSITNNTCTNCGL